MFTRGDVLRVETEQKRGIEFTSLNVFVVHLDCSSFVCNGAFQGTSQSPLAPTAAKASRIRTKQLSEATERNTPNRRHVDLHDTNLQIVSLALVWCRRQGV